MNRLQPEHVVARFSPPILSVATESALYPLHSDNSHELICVVSGSGLVYVNGTVLYLQAGDLLLITGTCTHGFIMQRGTRCMMAGINRGSMEDFTAYIDSLRLPYFLIREALRDRSIKRVVDYVLANPALMKSGIKLMGEFGGLLDRIATFIAYADTLPVRAPDTRVDMLARAAYSEVDKASPSAQRLADALDMSLAHTSRTVHAELGLPFGTYAAFVRTFAARRLLVQSDKTVERIAEMCHYDSIRTFDRQFKAVAGITATQYRARCAASQIADNDSPILRPKLETFFGTLAAKANRSALGVQPPH